MAKNEETAKELKEKLFLNKKNAALIMSEDGGERRQEGAHILLRGVGGEACPYRTPGKPVGNPAAPEEAACLPGFRSAGAARANEDAVPLCPNPSNQGPLVARNGKIENIR